MKETLVSIVIISYNSEDFILEALESAKNQTYKNIELIISDDGSTDSTIKKTENWLLKNKGRFVDSKFIKADQNTGITSNLNRGVRGATGEYIKMIAADDILLDNCVEDLLGFIQKKNISFCFSRALPFSDTKDVDFTKGIVKIDEKNYNYFFRKSQIEQYYALLRLTIPLSIIIGGFYSKYVLEKVGYFDEAYEMMEDYPFMMNLAKLGGKFELLDKYTSKYRVRDVEDKENFKKTRRFIAHYNNLREFRKKEIIPLMKKENMYFSILYLKVVMLLLHIEYNGDNKLLHFIMMRLRNVKKLLMKVEQ